MLMLKTAKNYLGVYSVCEEKPGEKKCAVYVLCRKIPKI